MIKVKQTYMETRQFWQSYGMNTLQRLKKTFEMFLADSFSVVKMLKKRFPYLVAGKKRGLHWQSFQ